MYRAAYKGKLQKANELSYGTSKAKVGLGGDKAGLPESEAIMGG
jgi:hypothetical protein